MVLFFAKVPSIKYVRGNMAPLKQLITLLAGPPSFLFVLLAYIPYRWNLVWKYQQFCLLWSIWDIKDKCEIQRCTLDCIVKWAVNCNVKCIFFSLFFCNFSCFLKWNLKCNFKWNIEHLLKFTFYWIVLWALLH